MIIEKLTYSSILLVFLFFISLSVSGQDDTDLYGNNVYEEPNLYSNNQNYNNSIIEAPDSPQTNTTCDSTQLADFPCTCSNCDCSGAPCPPGPCATACGEGVIPLDGGASILLLLGGMFGAKKAYDYSKKEKEE